MTESPSRHDAVTMPCPVCQHPFTPNGRPRRPITVYECDQCGTRALGEQRCDECSLFMRRVGYGGTCPHCDEPVSMTELTDQEATT